MSRDFLDLRDALGRDDAALETGTVTAVRDDQAEVSLGAGRVRWCWGQAAPGAAVVVQGDRIVARGRQGRVLVYDV